MNTFDLLKEAAENDKKVRVTLNAQTPGEFVSPHEGFVLLKRTTFVLTSVLGEILTLFLQERYLDVSDVEILDDVPLIENDGIDDAIIVEE